MATDVPAVHLKPRKALPFFSQHPWVFEGAIARVAGSPAPGNAVKLISAEGKFVAWGLFNPHSAIRVRLYSWDEAVPLDDSFWAGRISAAIGLRRRMFAGTPTEQACRLVSSEGDGLSGLTVDRFGDWLLLQSTSLAVSQREELIVRVFQEQLQPRGIWRRTEKGIAEAEGLEIRDGLVAGETPPRPILIEENGLQFAVDVVEGQKTGFYFDQRRNRLAAARYAAGKRVLDTFCYSGGFGLAALREGGAREVVAVDTSAGALELARRNAELNGLADRMRFLQGDCYRQLEQFRDAGEQFGVVVLDPPKMTRTRSGIDRAVRGYHSLNKLGLSVLAPGGILVTCSCSGLVDRSLFESMLAGVALDTGRRIQVLESRGAAADHPLNLHCPENAYLKCYICRVE